MTPEDFNYFQSRVSRFISGSQRGIRFGSSVTPKVTRIAGIFPKRQVPQQIVSGSSEQTDPEIGAPKRVISSLGRLTLDLEIVNNNLDRIAAIILQDYKETQDTNKKEIEDFRKRVANRGRVFGKKELGDKKSDVLGAVKKYVGSFFSGAGGAIRALSLFNLMQGILTGDPSKIIGPLLGIGLTYLPAIGAGIAGAVVTSLVGRLFGGGAATRAAASAAPAAAGAGGALGRLGRFGGRAALLGGGIALASSIFNRPQEEQSQQRLEELTQQQKALTDPQSLVQIPQDDLKRFEKLNKKFEAALDFLLGKQKEQDRQPQRTGGGGGGGAPPPSGELLSGDAPSEVKTLMDMIASPESGGNYEAMYPGTELPGATNMTIAEVARKATGPVGRYQHKPQYLEERARAVGLDPNTDKFTPENQDKITRGHLASLYRGGEAELLATLKQDPSKVKQKLEQSTYTGLQKYGSDFNTLFGARLGQYGTSLQTPPPAPVLPAPLQPRPVATAAPSRPQTQVNLLPLQTQQQSSQASAVSGSNDTVPSIDTTYPENFLALYSKLIYQIV